jgi:hypothetical protein
MDGFACFDAIGCITGLTSERRAAALPHRLERLGVDRRVMHIASIRTPSDPRIGLLLGHRRVLEAAAARGAETVLAFDDNVLFLDTARTTLADAASEIARIGWSLCFLGGERPDGLELVPDCRHLEWARDIRFVHAVAYHRRAYTKLLAVASWIDENGDLDACLGRIAPSVILRTPVTSLPELLPFEAADRQFHFTV